MKRPLLIVAFLTLACAATLVPIMSTPPMLLSDADGGGWKCSRSAMILTTCVPDRDVRFVPHKWMPSRPREFHPERLTDPDLILSHHPARAID